MKKLIACLLGGLMLLSVAATPVASLEIINDNKVLVNTFYVSDFADLMEATHDLKAGDTFTLVSSGPGGNAWMATAMMQYIAELEARGIHIITETYGLAASANAYVWLASSDRRVHKTDMLMFHLSKMGNGRMPESEKKLITQHLDGIFRQRLLDVVQDTKIVNEMLDDENNWYTGAEIIKLGIAKEIK